MATLPQSSSRFATLDIIRGIAVMGILVANMPAFSLPESAYFSPMSWGGHGPAELTAWATNFILVEGKMRGLFSFLFGASMLLVIERARASGQNQAGVHLSRMAVLFVIGLLHLYLIWWGDILAHYALVGLIAYAFTRLRTRALLIWGLAMLGLSLFVAMGGYMALIESAARGTPQQVETWANFGKGFGIPPAGRIAQEIAAYQGGWSDNLRWRWTHATDPVSFLPIVGPQTLSAMLFGMAAYRSGFLTGEWDRKRYARWAMICLGIAWSAYALLAVRTYSDGFDQRSVFFASIVASDPFRMMGTVGYAALFIWLIRPESRLGQRLAAVGRAAFTNYLGTSMIVTAIFYGWGLGLYSELSRAEIYLVPLLVWAIMLAWSKPWLERFHYGPLEWLWRSLSRWEVQPMRKAVATAAA
jgi:uncharacterized protein